MSLGQTIINGIETFFLNNLFIVIWLFILGLFFMDFYSRFIKVNRDTDHINLGERYLWLEFYRKHYGRRANDK